MSNIFNVDFQEFLKAFEDCHVEYVLIGGYSVIVHGYNRTTGDMDLFVNVSESNYQKIVKAFEVYRLPVFDMTKDKFFDSENYDVFTFGRPPVSIDIMTKVKGVNFEEVYTNRIRHAVNEKMEINVIHINQLIQAKLKSGRSKDLADIEYLTNKGKQL